MRLLLLAFLACQPSKVQIKDNHGESFTEDTNYDNQSPTEFGVIEKEDCDQAALGSNVCNIVLYDQNDNIWELYEHSNKIIVLDFSTAWCYPCQLAGYKTQSIQDDYNNDVVFVTFLIEGLDGAPATLEDVQTWVIEHNITSAPILQASREYVLDPAGITGYLVGGFPTYVYLDKNLKISTAHVGFSEEYVRQVLDGML
jgi:thiol-disulfide isomerase/thioredoxin